LAKFVRENINISVIAPLPYFALATLGDATQKEMILCVA
jgi:hypothetical protein